MTVRYLSDVRGKPLGVEIELPEDERGIADLHAIVGDFGQTDLVAGEIHREKDRVAPPFDGPSALDAAHDRRVGIDEGREAGRVRPRRGRIDLPRRPMVRETRVRSLKIVFHLEGIKGALLRRQTAGGRAAESRAL